MSDAVRGFLSAHEEKLKLNQFWYSAPTIACMVAEIEQHATRCAFLSTPSLFFSLSNAELQSDSTLFDVSRRTQPAHEQSRLQAAVPPADKRVVVPCLQFDEMWADNPRFVKYDFHAPLDVTTLRNTRCRRRLATNRPVLPLHSSTHSLCSAPRRIGARRPAPHVRLRSD